MWAGTTKFEMNNLMQQFEIMMLSLADDSNKKL